MAPEATWILCHTISNVQSHLSHPLQHNGCAGIKARAVTSLG